MDKIDIAQNEAYETLLHNGRAFAVIYGYNYGSGFIPLHPVVVKKTEQEVQDFGKNISRSYEARAGVTLYVFYRSQLPELLDHFGVDIKY